MRAGIVVLGDVAIQFRSATGILSEAVSSMERAHAVFLCFKKYFSEDEEELVIQSLERITGMPQYECDVPAQLKTIVMYYNLASFTGQNPDPSMFDRVRRRQQTQ